VVTDDNKNSSVLFKQYTKFVFIAPMIIYLKKCMTRILSKHNYRNY